ncbi:UNVERIFIED_CONTAM: Methyltransferase-like protein 2 [Sesamum radiatum]|uniref:Methyltransferase-like protein 2 n=1 Tax=Sesamum radiatum TaxID=300843 RepID=A0AAW2QEB1_SESRA
MAASESDDRLLAFLDSGIYRFDDANAFFVDPVRVLNRCYTRFRVSPSAYYSRFFPSSSFSTEIHNNVPKNSGKRKRREKEKKKSQALNLREQMADRRHQAHEALLGASQVLETLRNLRDDGEERAGDSILPENELDFVELGSVWQAPFYEIVLKVNEDEAAVENAGGESYYQKVVPLFENHVANEASNDMEAELLDQKYILPKNSCFYMVWIGNLFRQIHNLIPGKDLCSYNSYESSSRDAKKAESDCGFNLILIDPPWENSSAHQKLKYRTLPNRYFLSLPIKQLTHTAGALVALWVTNREKLRNFVENELFPKWGVKYATAFHWLKVKADGSLISELDLFHHRPYECLLLGYSHGKEMNSEHLLRPNHIPDNQVFISVPGDYSRKPPIGDILLEYVPGFKPARCIELFSREMIAGSNHSLEGQQPIVLCHVSLLLINTKVMIPCTLIPDDIVFAYDKDDRTFSAYPDIYFSISKWCPLCPGLFYKTKRLWDELTCPMPTPHCTCGSSKAMAELTACNQLMQFLMGLNDVYDHMLTPLQENRVSEMDFFVYEAYISVSNSIRDGKNSIEKPIAESPMTDSVAESSLAFKTECTSLKIISQSISSLG